VNVTYSTSLLILLIKWRGYSREGARGMLTRDNAPTTNNIKILKPKKIKPKNKIRRNTRSAESQGWQWLYKTKRYLVRRKAFMANHPYCAICGKIATDLDHVVPHKGDLRLFYDEKNWQSLCGVCHRRKTVKENAK